MVLFDDMVSDWRPLDFLVVSVRHIYDPKGIVVEQSWRLCLCESA
jgi:hypothetical protein